MMRHKKKIAYARQLFGDNIKNIFKEKEVQG